jgi:hypothetical protein
MKSTRGSGAGRSDPSPNRRKDVHQQRRLRVGAGQRGEGPATRDRAQSKPASIRAFPKRESDRASCGDRIGPATSNSLLTGKITGYLQIFRPFWPPFGQLYVNSLGNSNALRQIPCSTRNPDFFRSDQGIDPVDQGIYRDRLHRPLSVSRSGIGRVFNRILMSVY